MSQTKTPRALAATLLVLSSLSASSPAAALTADLGSDGSYGPINVTVDTVLPLPADGIFRATTVTIATGRTLRFSYTGPLHPGVVILATGDVTIAGTIDVSGGDSTVGTTGAAGPGGTPGGAASNGSHSGALPTALFVEYNPSRLVGLRPIGGTGGSNAYTGGSCTSPGAGGGGGGGSLVVFSNTKITGTGSIDASGGTASTAVPSGGVTCSVATGTPARHGSDGTVRLAAPEVSLLGATLVAEQIRIDAALSRGAPTIASGPLGLQRSISSGTTLTKFPATLPVATITRINGTTVAPASVFTLPTGSTEPIPVTVHVVGCTSSTLRALVVYQPPSNSPYWDATTLANPTGSDDVIVSVGAVSPVFANDTSALLYPAVLCGPDSTP